MTTSTATQADMPTSAFPGSAAPGARSASGVPDDPAQSAPVVMTRGLTKVFRDFWMRPRARAVDQVDFDIHRGEIFGLLGPNGSGKSTTIKIILGLLKKTSGRLAVFGKPPTDVSIKSRIGYLPEESYLYRFLNARETLDYYGKLFKLPDKVRAERIDELLDMVGLTAVQHRPVGEYSKGMQRRIGLAQALINDPEFLILDEPTTGLDPIGTRQVKDLIIALGERGKTILLSSHQLSDVEDVVDRMVVLYGGRIRASGTCDSLLDETSRSVIETEALDEATLNDLRDVLAKHAKRVERVSPARQRLEDLFVQLVEQARQERLANAGAAHGGATAAFLQGRPERQREGGQLIDELTAEQREDPLAERDMQAESAPKPAESDQQAVIGSLMDDDQAEDQRERASQPRPQASPDVSESTKRPAPPAGGAGEPDESVISSLLGESDDDADDSPRDRTQEHDR
jgi:ABC-2 type transport system ATP-binding protein